MKTSWTRYAVVLIVAVITATASIGCAADEHSANSGIGTDRPLVSRESQVIEVAPIDFGEPGAGFAPSQVEVRDSVKAFVAPQTWPVMQVEGSVVSQSTVAQLADKLGLVSPSISVGDHGALASDAHWQLQFTRADDATCFILISSDYLQGSYQKGVATGERILSLPTSDEARRIADDYLEGLGLLSGLQFVDASPKTIQDTSRGSVPTSIGVCYRPLVNGAVVEGPGAKVVVIIGENNQILVLHHLVQNWVEVGATNIRPVTEALADIQAGRGVPPPEDWERVVVENVHLASYAEPSPLGKTQLKPVYVFEATNADKPDLPTQTYIVSALPEG